MKLTKQVFDRLFDRREVNSMDAFLSLLAKFNWNYLFIVVGVFGLLGGLFALWRGIYHTSCKFIIEGVLIVCLVFCMGPLVSWLSSISIAGIYKNPIVINGVSITVTSLDETLVKCLEASGYASSVSAADLYTIAINLAHAILGFVLFFVGILLIILLGWVISEIIYSVTFNIIVPKEARANHKHRFISFLLGLVCSTVIGALLISPLTSAANALTDAASGVKTNETNSEQYGKYESVLDLLASYKNSAYYSAMHLGSSDPSKAVDSNLMDTVTSVTIQGTSSSLSDQIQTLVSVIPDVSAAMSYTGDKFAIDAEQMLSPDNISAVLTTMKSWTIIIGMLPALAEVADNLPAISSNGLTLNLSDLSSDDFSGTLDDINVIYRQMYDAGLISQYAIPSLRGEATPAYFSFDYSKKENYKTLIRTLAENSIIKDNLPVLLSYEAKALTGNNPLSFISTLESDYEDIDFASDLEGLVEFAFDAFKVLGITQIDSQTLSNLTANLMDKISDSANLANVQSLFGGGTISFEGEEDFQFDGLLSLDLLTGSAISIPDFIKYAFSKVDGINSFLPQETIDKLADDLGGSANIKDEFKKFLAVLPDVYDLSKNGFDISKEESRSKLSTLLDKVASSTIVSDILPGMLKSVLAGDSIKDMLFGLSADDFDLNPVDSEGKSILVSEIKALLGVVGDGLSISSIFASSDTSSMLASFSDATEEGKANLAKLTSALTGLEANKVINPLRSKDGSSTKVKDLNFSSLIEGVFSNASLKQVGLELPYDLSGLDWTSEISSLSSILGILGRNPSFVNGNVQLENIPAGFVRDLFSAIGSSSLLKDSLPSLLTSNLAPTIEDLGVTVNFFAISDWTKEGEAFESIIQNLKDLGSGVSLSNIDWANLDGQQINAILTSLSETGMLAVQKDDNGIWVDKFGELAYTMIDKAGISADMIGSSISQSNFTTVTDKYAASAQAAVSGAPFTWKGVLASSYTLNGTTYNSSVDTSGEIYKISAIFSAFKDLPKDSSGSPDFSKATGQTIKPILLAISSSSTFAPCLSNLLAYALKDINVSFSSGSSLAAKSINTSALNSTNSASEINLICDLYDQISSTSSDSLINTLSKNSSNLSAITDQQFMDLESLLNNMASSEMMTTVKAGYNYSFFDSLLGEMLDQTTLDQMITGLSDGTQKTAVLPLLSQIDDWKFDVSTAYVKDVNGNNTSTIDSSAPTVEASEILRLTRTLRFAARNNISVSSLTSPSNIEADVIKTLLTDLNRSEILHYSLGKFFADIFQSMGLVNTYDSSHAVTSYSIFWDSTDTVEYRKIDPYIHLNASYDASSLAWNSDVTYWDNEISCLSDLFTALKSSSGSSLSLSNIKIGSSGTTLYSYLKPIDSMKLLEDSKEYVILHFLKSASSGSSTSDVSGYLRNLDSTSSFAANSLLAARIRADLFWDGHQSQELSVQCGVLDAFISKLTSLKDADFLNDTTGTVASSFFDLMMSSFKIADDGSYTRGYLAQELLAGLLKDRFSVANGFTASVASFFSTFFYSSDNNPDFLYMNIIEARGLAGIVSMSSLMGSGSSVSYNDPSFQSAIKAAFTKMGRESTTTVYTGTEAKYETMLGNAEAKASLTYTGTYKLDKYRNSALSSQLNNSRVALILFETYEKQVTVSFGTTKKTMDQIISEYNTAVDTAIATGVNPQNLTASDKILPEEQSMEKNGNNVIKALAYMATIYH
jgi:hypothetical protein